MDSLVQRPAVGHILVVEDSQFQVRFYQQILQTAGYSVELASTGEVALQCMRTRKPDLVLLDVGLPGITGHAVCTAIRDDPATHELPVIMLTATSDVSSLVTGMKSGADDFVSKSADTGTLLARIARLLERSRMYRRISDAERLDMLKTATSIAASGIRLPLRLALRSIDVLESFEIVEPRMQKARAYVKLYLERIQRLLANIEDVSRIASKTFIARDRIVDVKKALIAAEEMARLPTDPEEVLGSRAEGAGSAALQGGM